MESWLTLATQRQRYKLIDVEVFDGRIVRTLGGKGYDSFSVY